MGPWRRGDELSRLLLDVAASRVVPRSTQVDEESVQLAHQHGLVGLMVDSHNPSLREAAFPAFVRGSARQEVMKKHLRRLLHSFNDAGIKVAVLKGPYLAEFAYRNPSHRMFTDIDLLVPRRDLDRALDVLLADPQVASIPTKKPKADKRDVPLTDPATGITFNLDLHWDLFSYAQLQGSAEGATDEFWTAIGGPTETGFGPLWHLPDATGLAFLCAHAVLDHRFRLILFRDLTEATLRQPDWEDVGRFATRWGLRSTTYLALLMASHLTDAPVPPEFLASLRPSGAAIRAAELLLPRTDLVRFDGKRPHPLNLAIVLLHDSRVGRARLAVRAPIAFPEWFRRVAGGSWVLKRTALRRRRPPLRQPPLVLHVLPLDIARGAQTYAKALRESLDSAEVEHRTATIFRSDSSSLDADVEFGIAHGLGRRLGFSIWALVRLWAYVRRHRPNVVVAHGGEALKYAAFARRSSTRIAYYKIGTSEQLLQNPLRRRFHQWLTGRADLVAGVSNEMVEEARTLLGASADRIEYIPNGRDPAVFDRQAVPTQISPVRFLFVGHLTRTKRPELFLEVVATLRKRGVDARGVMVGDGPLLEGLRRTSPEGVEFLGSRNDVPQLLADADILLFTSTTEGEGMPGVLIEAGLAGLPVVTTDVPGARTVVDDGTTGLVVPVNDLVVLIDASERLAKDPDLRKALGAAARQRCLDRFTLESSVELWRGHLKALMLEAGR